MLKKILSLLLVAVMLTLFCACNANNSDAATDAPDASGENDKADATEKADPSDTPNATESPDGTDGNSTDNDDKTEPTDEGDNDKKPAVPEANVPEGSILLSGENRYRVVYAKGFKKTAMPIYEELFYSDPLSSSEIGYYSLSGDTVKDDGTPEILVGLTDRELSAKAAAMVKSEKDYVILAEGNKIAIYSETSSFLEKAVEDFISKMSLVDEYHILYTNEKEYLVEYVAPAAVSLDGKQVMFIGNSFIYYGNCVNYALDDADRHILDDGYFYQICKANDEEVEVYNYTWMAKSLDWIYENQLSKESEEFFEQFDYVFISEAGSNNSKIVSIVEKITKLFPETTNFAYLVHSFHASNSHEHIYNACKKDFVDMGIEVVDWGGLVYDVWSGNVEVPGAQLTHNKLTYIKNNTDVSKNPDDANVGAGRPSDNYHENPLAGYITAQMAYCVATNKSAIGQDYSFCGDTSIHKFFDFDEFIDSHYGPKYDTNFPEVFNSDEDMAGLQELMDLYIAKYEANN